MLHDKRNWIAPRRTPAFKTETLAIRLSAAKAALRQAAKQGQRSLSNMIKVMIRDWCGHERDEPSVGQPAPVERRS